MIIKWWNHGLHNLGAWGNVKGKYNAERGFQVAGAGFTFGNVGTICALLSAEYSCTYRYNNWATIIQKNVGKLLTVTSDNPDLYHYF